jgi:hypothetical protein
MTDTIILTPVAYNELPKEVQASHHEMEQMMESDFICFTIEDHAG